MSNQGIGKVLIADNDEDVLVALEHALESGGYTTATALSQDQISKLLTQGEFDLCVLDDCLSDNDSIGVLAELQEPGEGRLSLSLTTVFPKLTRRLSCALSG
jgi:DNA-binding NtrC family response regulator